MLLVLPETSSLRARRWCSLGPLRTRAGSVVHCSCKAVQHGMLCKGSREGRRRGGEKEGRGNGGWGEGSVQEVARAAGSKAAGARVIGG
jgi:hypothetical protein